ncbi:MAG: universal stress protein UspA [Deltaproteobacteria bacterium SG8_13]|nr:MAG: universal stress protein UspA [Deltaproteobacteria bacterium SG8_13]
MNIVVGYDGSRVSADVIRVAKLHARVFDAKIYLIHSLKGGPEYTREEFESAERELERALRVFSNDSISSESKLLVRGLDPGEDLVKFAEDHKSIEIVIGVRRRSRVGKALFGSTAQHVILNAPCPVVTVR